MTDLDGQAGDTADADRGPRRTETETDPHPGVQDAALPQRDQGPAVGVDELAGGPPQQPVGVPVAQPPAQRVVQNRRESRSRRTGAAPTNTRGGR